MELIFFNSDIEIFLLKTNGGETESLSLLFFSLECVTCRWVDNGGVEQRLLFRAGRLKSHLLCSWFYSIMGDPV